MRGRLATRPAGTIESAVEISSALDVAARTGNVASFMRCGKLFAQLSTAQTRVAPLAEGRRAACSRNDGGDLGCAIRMRLEPTAAGRVYGDATALRRCHADQDGPHPRM
jgi:hypothetical protein